MSLMLLSNLRMLFLPLLRLGMSLVLLLHLGMLSVLLLLTFLEINLSTVFKCMALSLNALCLWMEIRALQILNLSHTLIFLRKCHLNNNYFKDFSYLCLKRCTFYIMYVLKVAAEEGNTFSVIFLLNKFSFLNVCFFIC